MTDSHQVVIDYENWLASITAPKKIKQDDNAPKNQKPSLLTTGKSDYLYWQLDQLEAWVQHTQKLIRQIQKKSLIKR
jgi:hypothetical protein